MKMKSSYEKPDLVLPVRMSTSKNTKIKRLTARAYAKLFTPGDSRQRKVSDWMEHGDKHRKCDVTSLIVDGASRSVDVPLGSVGVDSDDTHSAHSIKCLHKMGSRERHPSVKGIGEPGDVIGCTMPEGGSLPINIKESGEYNLDLESEMKKPQPNEGPNYVEVCPSTESLLTCEDEQHPIEGQSSVTHKENLASVVSSGDHLPQVSDKTKFVFNDGTQACNAQENLHESLKIELSRLCEALLLPKNVTDGAAIFLEYVMTSSRVRKMSKTILQALLIALCRMSSSIWKHDLGCRASVLVARDQLQFTCKTKAVKIMYCQLRSRRKHLKRKILYRPTGLINFSGSSSHEQASKEGTSNLYRNMTPHAKHQEIVGTERHNFRNDEAPSGITILIQLDSVKNKRLRFIYRKQREELAEFAKFKDMEAKKLFTEYAVEYSNILQESDSSIRAKELNSLSFYHACKEETFRKQMKMCQKALKDKHEQLMKYEAQSYLHWLKEAECGNSVEPYVTLPLPNICFQKELWQSQVQVLADKRIEKLPQNGSGNKAIISLSANELEDVHTVLESLKVAEGSDSRVYEASVDKSSPNNTALDSPTTMDLHKCLISLTEFERSEEVQLANRPLSIDYQKQGDIPSISSETSGMGIIVPKSLENSDCLPQQSNPSSHIADGLLPKFMHEDSQGTCEVFTLNSDGRAASAVTWKEHGHPTSLGEAGAPVWQMQSLQYSPSIQNEMEHLNQASSPMHFKIKSSQNIMLMESETPSQPSPVDGVVSESCVSSLSTDTTGAEILLGDNPLLQKSSTGSQVADKPFQDFERADLKGSHPDEASIQPLGIFSNSSTEQDTEHLPLGCSIMKSQILASPEVVIADRPFPIQTQKHGVLAVWAMESETLVQSDPCNTTVSQTASILGQLSSTTTLPVSPQSGTNVPLLHQGGSSSKIASGFCPEPPHIVSQGIHLVSSSVPGVWSADAEREHENADSLQVEISSPQQVVSSIAISEQEDSPRLQSNSRILPSQVDIGDPTYPEDDTTSDIYVCPNVNIFPASTFRIRSLDDGDPLLQELFRLSNAEEKARKLYEDKKTRTIVQCDKLVEDVTRKYCMLLAAEDRRYLHSKKNLVDNLEKVKLHFFLAEAFRFQFTDHIKMQSSTPSGFSTRQALEQPGTGSWDSLHQSDMASSGNTFGSSDCDPRVNSGDCRALQRNLIRPKAPVSAARRVFSFGQLL